MKKPPETTLTVLTDIRGEIRAINGRIDAMVADIHGTNGRVDAVRDEVRGTNGRIDTLRDELSRRIVESEVRTATALTDLAGSVREMTAHLRGEHELRPRVERCEQDIAELKARLPHAS